MRIIRGKSRTELSGARISAQGPDLAVANAQANAARIVNTDVTEGNRAFAALISLEGRKLFEESKQAHNASVLLEKTAEAQEEYKQRMQERKAATRDEKGNFNFDKMVDDSEAIGQEIKQRLLEDIIDPELAQSVDMELGAYFANQKLSTLKEALELQDSQARASLADGIEKTLILASNDTFDQVGTYESSVRTALDGALAGGLINPEQHQQMLSKAKRDMRVSSIRQTMLTNRGAAVEILSRGDIGLHGDDVIRLQKELNSLLKADAAAREEAVVAASTEEQIAQAELIDQLEARLEVGALTEAEVVSAEDKLSPKAYSKLVAKFKKVKGEQRASMARVHEMSKALANGEGVGNASTDDIDVWYRNKTLNAETLAQKAEVAGILPVGVRAFRKEMETSILSAPESKAKDILEAFSWVRDRKKVSLSDMGAKERAIAVSALRRVEMAAMAPEEALRTAREDILSLTPEVEALRKAEFAKDSSMQLDSIINTASADLRSFWDDLTTEDVDASVAANYRALVREQFLLTGDLEAAREAAAEGMQKTHGYSELANGKFMHLPPEKIFSNPDRSKRITAPEMKRMLEAEFGEGATVKSDFQTRMSLRNKMIYSWAVYDADGKPVLVDGEHQRWSPQDFKEGE